MTFEDILRENGIPYHTTGKHTSFGWIQFDCPFCGKDTGKFHMGFNLESKFVNCWKCGYHHLDSMLRELIPSLTQPLVKEMLEDKSTYHEIARKIGTYKEPKGITPRMETAQRRYLKNRRFNPDALIRQWGIQGIGLAGSPPWRLFIPVIHQGVKVAWQTRSLNDLPNVPRYLSSSVDDSKHHLKSLLYGEDYCRNAIIICEGPTDVWRIGPGAVATFGTAVTPAQVYRISKYPVKAICFDDNRVAQVAADMLAEQLLDISGGPIHNFHIGEGLDPGSMDPEQVKEIRQLIL